MSSNEIGEATAGQYPLFRSIIQGGFECSTQRRSDGRRLDLLVSTGHADHALYDYTLLASLGIRTVRDGIRWHVVEARGPDRRDWSNFISMLRAASSAGTQVIWDLMHYGWPDDLDIWTPHFVSRFANYAATVARIVRDESEETPIYCPVNEISFLAWAGGDAQLMNPMARGRSFELKAQLVRATVEAINAIRVVDPNARFLHCDPVVRINPLPDRPQDRQVASDYQEAQYQGWDMLAGQLWPQLGGGPECLDLIGVNYYPTNQWFYGGSSINPEHPLWVPFEVMLHDIKSRYQRPVLISETGAEGAARAPWFRSILAAVTNAACQGTAVHGICLYPIIDHIGWDDDRACPSGLLSRSLHRGKREIHEPLLHALQASGLLNTPPFDGTPAEAFREPAYDLGSVFIR